MVNVYGTRVALTPVSDTCPARFTSHPMWFVLMRDEPIGMLVKNPAGWFEVYTDGTLGPFRETRTDALNKLIAFAEYNARQRAS